MLVGIVFFSVCAQTYSDVSEEHWAYPVIQNMTEKKIVNGYPDGTFCPNKAVTRAEFAKIMTLSLSLSKRQARDFEDVANDFWGKEYVDTVCEFLPIEMKDGKQYFKPNTEALREEVVTAMVLALDFENEFAKTKMVILYSVPYFKADAIVK